MLVDVHGGVRSNINIPNVRGREWPRNRDQDYAEEKKRNAQQLYTLEGMGVPLRGIQTACVRRIPVQLERAGKR